LFEPVPGSMVPDCFNGPDSHAAVKSFLEPFAAGSQKIARPAIQIHAIDKIGFRLRGLAEMFPGRIIRVADRSIAILIINSILAPNITLAHMNILLFGEIFEILCSQESSHHTFRTETVAHEF
jgi:hypothetical protein